MSSDLSVLSSGIQAGAAKHQRLVAFYGILVSLLLLGLLLVVTLELRAGSVDPLWGPLLMDDAQLVLGWYAAVEVLLLWLVWSFVGGVIERGTILASAGLPTGSRAHLAAGLRRWPSHFAAPVLMLVSVLFLAVLIYGISFVTLVPYAGWPIFVLLSPVLLFLALKAVWIVLRWLLAGHLAGPAIADEGCDAFRALFRSYAWLRTAPGRTLLVRVKGFLAFLGHSVCRTGLAVAAVLLVALALIALPEGDGNRLRQVITLGFSGEEGGAAVVAVYAFTLLAILVGAWVLSYPVAMFFAARASAYLVLRRDLDGVPLDQAAAHLDPRKTIEELGFELVETLRVRSEEE